MRRMLGSVWVVVSVAACEGPTTAEATPDEVIGHLRVVNMEHQQAVQDTTDIDVIQSLEDRYEPDWRAATDEVWVLLAERECLKAAEEDGGITAEAWLDTLDSRVAEHVVTTEGFWKFSECWGAETDHHHEIIAAIEGLEGALEDCL